jgi:hypothetical protein
MADNCIYLGIKISDDEDEIDEIFDDSEKFEKEGLSLVNDGYVLYVGIMLCETDERSGGYISGVSVKTVMREEKRFRVIMKKLGYKNIKVEIFIEHSSGNGALKIDAGEFS